MRVGAPPPSRPRQLSHSQSGSGARNGREQELKAEGRKRSISCGGDEDNCHGQWEGRVSAAGQDGLLSSAGFASGQAGSDRMNLTTVEVGEDGNESRLSERSGIQPINHDLQYPACPFYSLPIHRSFSS